MNTAASRCSSTGTVWARRTKTAPAGSASPRSGPATAGAPSNFRASTGSHRRFPRRRPRPAHHHRAGLQRSQQGAVHPAGQQDAKHDQVAELDRGTTDTFNELRFEDKKGSEEIYFHAEKDFNRVVENNDTLKVGFDKKDKGDQTIEIFNNQSSRSATTRRTTAARRSTSGITAPSPSSKATRSWRFPRATASIVDKGNDTHTVSSRERQPRRSDRQSQGNDTHTISKGNREVDIDAGNDTLNITQGDLNVKITAGKCTISAGTSIELTVGGSSIKIEPAKITISSAEIAVSGDAKVAIEAPMIDMNGSGMTKVQGGIVKVN